MRRVVTSGLVVSLWLSSSLAHAAPPSRSPAVRWVGGEDGASVASAPPWMDDTGAGPAPTPTPTDVASASLLGTVSEDGPQATVSLGPDEVELSDGGFVRGTVVESRPGTLVRVVVAGESTPRTFAWSEVKTVVRGKYDPAAAPPSSETAAPRSPTGSSGTGFSGTGFSGTGFSGTGPRVHLVATRKAPGRLHLFEISGASVGTAYGYGRTTSVVATTYQRVCVEPCGEVVDTSRGSPFVVHAEGMMPSRSFELPRSGEVTVEVEPRHRGLAGGGLALAFVGIAVMTTGMMFAVVEGIGDDSDPARIAGWSTMAVGGAGMVGGGLVMTLIRSKVRVRQGAPSR